MLHIFKKIIDCCIAPFESIKISLKSFRKSTLSHQKHKLFENSSSLCVCNPIKYRVSYIRICYLTSYRVSCWASFIVLITPRFSISKVYWRRLKLMKKRRVDILKCIMRYIISETFIKPEIIPPYHSNEVTKPVMRQLMSKSYCKFKIVILCWVFKQQFLLIVCHKPSIFHCPVSKISHKNLVIFLEGEKLRKVKLVKIHWFRCDIKDKITICLKKEKSWRYTV